jgi:4-diphosphocytidyl-2-C-methyl-D-erythritol kinase
LRAVSILSRQSGCKVNLLLNILGKRPDGFHELETIMQPIALFDELRFEQSASGVQLTCSEPALPTDSRNLVHRAATSFLEAASIRAGVRIHLEKRIPMAAGLGGGSANAATGLLGLNELFGQPLAAARLHELAASLGSDVPFFLQPNPALATGRGEQLQPLEPFAALRGKAFVLVYPGFGVPTDWAYQHLASFPDAMNGKPGRATQLAAKLKQNDLAAAAPHFYNALEFPVLRKYPLLAIIREFMESERATVARMSGSGSTIFGITEHEASARSLEEKVRGKFGPCWTAVVPA